MKLPTNIPTAAKTTDYRQYPNFNSYATALAREIRNPLTNIGLSIEMLESEIKDKDLKIYLDIIMRSSVRINNFIDELLKYHQEEKKHEVLPTPF
jgi:nitrogen-specific signal transduction histidine kinase